MLLVITMSYWPNMPPILVMRKKCWCSTSSNHLLCVMPVMSSAKLVENGAKPSQTVGKARKRVWG